MATAGRVLGDQVGSTAPAFLAILAIHVIAGLTAVITGAIAALTRKGSRRHRPGDTGHIAGMGIAYTAMLTAFYVDNGPHLPLWDRLPTLAFWLLPSAIAAPIITRAILRARNKPPAIPLHAGTAPPSRAAPAHQKRRDPAARRESAAPPE